MSPSGSGPSWRSAPARSTPDRLLLHGDRVTLRPLRAGDLPRIVEMLSEPEAALWWGEADEESLRADYLGESSEEEPRVQ